MAQILHSARLVNPELLTKSLASSKSKNSGGAGGGRARGAGGLTPAALVVTCRNLEVEDEVCARNLSVVVLRFFAPRVSLPGPPHPSGASDPGPPRGPPGSDMVFYVATMEDIALWREVHVKKSS